MVFVRFGYFAVLPEHSLKLHLSAPHCLATDRARLTAPGTTHRAVRTSRWQLPILDRFAGFLAQSAIVHLSSDHLDTKSHPNS
jgi:hypothetical protein